MPESALSYEITGSTLFPKYLDARDRPWIAHVLKELERYRGAPRREWDRRVAEPWPALGSFQKRRLVFAVLNRAMRSEVKTDLDPKEVRRRIFAAGARRSSEEERRRAWSEIAVELGTEADSLRRALFADLPTERALAIPNDLSVDAIIKRGNRALIEGLLSRSREIIVRIEGDPRPVILVARTRGLICRAFEDRGATRLEISGPLSLFRRTLKYARELAQLPSALRRCDRFELRASCVVARGRMVELCLDSGAPLEMGESPKRIDRKIHDRLVRDFASLKSRWALIRSPEPIRVGGSFVFTDFGFAQGDGTVPDWYLEIVGFWTREHLDRKLELYTAADLKNVILAIDPNRGCDGQPLPPALCAVPIRQDRVDVQALLEILDRANEGRPATD